MKVSYMLTADDVAKTTRYIYMRKHKKAFFFRILTVGALWGFCLPPLVQYLLPTINLGVGNEGLFSNPMQLLYILPGMLMAFFLLRLQYTRLAQGAYKGNREFSAWKQLELKDDGLYITSENMETLMKWGVFDMVEEMEDLILFYTASVTAFIVPKSAFTDSAELATFLQAAYSNIGSEKTKREIPNHLVTEK